MNLFRKYINKYPTEFFLASLAMVTQSVIFVITYFFANEGFMWLIDSYSYLEIAKNLLIHKGFFVKLEWGPEAFRTPLYPIFIAIFYKLIPEVWFVILVQNILAIINVILAYRLGKLIFNSSVALMGALFLIFESARLVLANQLMSETLFVFFILLSILYINRFILRDSKWLYIIVASISIGLATLTRPIVQFVPLAVAIFFLILGIVKKDIKRYLFAIILFIICFFVIISPWLIRNYIHFGKWEISSVGAYNLYAIAGGRFFEKKLELQGEVVDGKHFLSYKAAKELNLVSGIDEFRERFATIRLMEPENEEYLTKEALGLLSLDWPFYAKLHAWRMIPFFMESSASRSYNALLYNVNLPSVIFYPILYFAGRILWILFYLAIFLSIVIYPKTYKKYLWNYLLLAGVILYFAFFSALFSDAGRFRQPVNPFIFLFLANAIILFYNDYKKRKQLIE